MMDIPASPGAPCRETEGVWKGGQRESSGERMQKGTGELAFGRGDANPIDQRKARDQLETGSPKTLIRAEKGRTKQRI